MRYWTGFATAVCGVALVAFTILALYVTPGVIAMYEEFGAELPASTAIATSPAWALTIIPLGLVAVLALNLRESLSERQRVLGLVAALTLIVATLTFTAWALYAPLFETTASIAPPA